MELTEEEVIAKLTLCAGLYAQYAGKYLTFFHTRSKKDTPERDTVYFGVENFMHLVGIRCTTASSSSFYEKCLEARVVIGDCTPTHSEYNRNEKIVTFPQLFDFAKSKIYSFAAKDLTTEYNEFAIATGGRAGTMGYDFRNPHSSVAIPVTLMKNPLFLYCSAPHKIIAVVRHETLNIDMDDIVYEIKQGVVETFL